jgi:NAD(P)-dependent dehydrogenase (short-subunit alcohol dehydrogenase family)
MRLIVTFLAITFAAAPLAGCGQDLDAKPAKAVLVTGASSGIGRKITERLAADGYFVYAGARKEADLQALGKIKNVQAVRLDVTKPEDIEAALNTIKKASRGLYGLVNNAGVASVEPLIETKPEEFDAIMAVNVWGPYRMTKAFAPLIITQKGRIINIGSISGILSVPGMGAYQMSKHAIESFTDVLAQELAPSGVHVSVVEPGSYDSAISQNAVERTGDKSQRFDRSMYKQPDEVAVAAEVALSEPQPKRRYMVVPQQDQAEMTIKAQIKQLVQLNEGQPYTVDRNALVKMLDDALAQARPRSK